MATAAGIILIIAVAATIVTLAEKPGQSRPGTILCLGDSMTYGAGGSHAYWYYLQNNTSLNVVGLGYPGYTTSAIIDVYSHEVTDQHPRYLLLLAGTNDFILSTNIATVEKNLENMYKWSMDNGTIPIPLTVLPTGSLNETINEQIIELNQWIHNFSTANNLACIDLYKIFEEPDEPGKFNYNYTLDGLHPNNQGYVLLSKSIIDSGLLK
jgi:lysophospholipase L1-like esterase